jgi:hypothetical protein
MIEAMGSDHALDLIAVHGFNCFVHFPISSIFMLTFPPYCVIMEGGRGKALGSPLLGCG